jgi:hypothetical protein
MWKMPEIGHTKAYCYHSPRCVKCAGTHRTTNCPRKERSDQVKCVLCSGNHPTNYKGCTVYKELQQRTFPLLRSKPDRTPLITQPQTSPRPDLSYAAALAPKQQRFETANPPTRQMHPQQQHISPQTNDIHELKTVMKQLMEQMSIMLHLLTTVVTKLS